MDDEAKRRADEVEALDALPTDLRLAIRECDFYIEIPTRTRGLDCTAVAALVRAVKSDADAVALNNRIRRSMRR